MVYEASVKAGTTDKVAAKALEAELLAKNRSAVQHQRATAHLIRLDVAAGLRPPEDVLHHRLDRNVRHGKMVRLFRRLTDDNTKYFRGNTF